MTRTVLVPTSLVREAEDRREATRKLGYVARAAAVFRVDRLCVFPDPAGEGDWGGGFVETVLQYAATPPYLRKEVWDVRDELEYAGVLPPLRLSPRAGSGSDDSGSSRQGIVTRVGSDGRVRVNCGLQHPISLHVPPGMEVTEGERVTVRVSSRRPVRARIVDERPPLVVERVDLAGALCREDAGIRIATSRLGTPLTLGRLARLAERVEEDGFTVAFGSPGRGLPEIIDAVLDGDAAIDVDTHAGDGGVKAAGTGFDRWLNTVPNQGSETIRTEEAMFASLAALSLTE